MADATNAIRHTRRMHAAHHAVHHHSHGGLHAMIGCSCGSLILVRASMAREYLSLSIRVFDWYSSQQVLLRVVVWVRCLRCMVSDSLSR